MFGVIDIMSFKLNVYTVSRLPPCRIRGGKRAYEHIGKCLRRTTTSGCWETGSLGGITQTVAILLGYGRRGGVDPGEGTADVRPRSGARSDKCTSATQQTEGNWGGGRNSWCPPRPGARSDKRTSATKQTEGNGGGGRNSTICGRGKEQLMVGGTICGENLWLRKIFTFVRYVEPVDTGSYFQALLIWVNTIRVEWLIWNLAFLCLSVFWV